MPGRSLLRTGKMEPLHAIAWRSVSGAELAWRQSGRHFGPGAKLPAATLWVLRRSHRRHIRRLFS
jgi:hypothetical protein